MAKVLSGHMVPTDTFTVEKTGCIGMCYLEPIVDIYEDDKTSRLHYLLNVQPCSYMSAVDFWRRVVQDLLLHGNAYIVPVREGLDIVSLSIVSPSAVTHDTTADLYKVNDRNAVFRFLQGCGKHSLWIYLLHQPILSGICYLIYLLK